MYAEFLLERRERTIKGVSGVGYVELRILLICEEIRKVSFEGMIRAVYALVGEVPMHLAV